MGIIESIILGAVQGITEFLPISSSGHLVLFQIMFGLNTENILFDISLHIATLGAVIFVFWKKVIDLIRHPFSPMAIKLYVATVPTVIMVLLFREYIENSFGSYFFLFGFVITALLLLITEFFVKKSQKPLGKLGSFFMGVAQGVATLPGISRSGSTISIGLMMGKDRKEVAEFSFLMSIPVILASLVYELFFSGRLILATNIIPLVLGMITSFVLGIIAIKFMLKIIQKTSLVWFALYLTIIVLLFAFIGL